MNTGFASFLTNRDHSGRFLMWLYPMYRYILTLLSLLLISSVVAADDSEFTNLSPLSATLMGWEHQSRLAILDRTAGYDGIATDRGVFYRFTPQMEEEYDLNLFTYRHTPREDRQFYGSPNGFRTALGNLNIRDLAHLTEIRNYIELSSGHNVSIDGVAQHDFQYNRLYIDLGYEYNLWGNHYIGANHNIGGFRPDLDAGLSYRIGNPQTGMMKMEYIFVDYANNIIFDEENFSPQYSDSTRVYEDRPSMITGTFITPELGGFRAEAVFGFHREAESEVRSTTQRNEGFWQTERMNYYGGLLEYIGEYATLGAIYKRQFSTTERDTLTGGSSMRAQYESEQTLNKSGFYMLTGSSEFEFESWAWFENYSDTQGGDFYDFSRIDTLDYSENRVWLRNRVQYDPPYRGIIGGLEFLLDFRDAKNDRDRMRNFSPSIRDMNARATAILGYRFHPRMSIVAGVGYDVDGDMHYGAGENRFDNAFTRFQFMW